MKSAELLQDAKMISNSTSAIKEIQNHCQLVLSNIEHALF